MLRQPLSLAILRSISQLPADESAGIPDFGKSCHPARHSTLGKKAGFRDSLAIELDTPLTSRCLVRVFEQRNAERGLPHPMRTDNALLALSRVLIVDYIDPGKPNRNACIQRFDRPFRTDVLDAYSFSSLAAAREIAWQWMQECADERRQDALGKLSPVEFPQKAKVSTCEPST